MDYREAGVDLEAGRAFVDRIEALLRQTHRPEVAGGVGHFGAGCHLPSGYREPMLISGADGVGTKLKLAQALDRHETVGIDLVAMCANDVLTAGAEPLLFLDYLATSQLDRERLARVVEGISQGCQASGCALLGGETAEMPDFYPAGAYDLAGFCVGVVERSRRLDGSQVRTGDVAIGLASQGPHSNGYSLIRRIVERGGWSWQECPSLLGGERLGEALLRPTAIYVRPILAALQAGIDIRGMAHITGGGLRENLPRCLNAGQAIALERDSWPVPPVFRWLAQAGDVSEAAMFEAFNMGIGFAVLVPAEHAEAALQWFRARDLGAWAIGEVIPGNGTVEGLPA